MFDIRIGFSMHPNWLGNGSLDDFVTQLCRAGLSALEFELDNRLPAWPAFPPLMEAAFRMGLALSFHAPYRPAHSIAGFAGDRCIAIQSDHAPLLAVAETWARRSPNCQALVVHAAAGLRGADRTALVEDTLAYLAWVGETYPNLRIALENNRPARGSEVKVGASREDVLALLEASGHPEFGACWDMGHDALAGETRDPSPDWLSRVTHVHVHDVEAGGEDHFPLIYGRVQHARWLPAWKSAGGRGLVVLELKGQHLQGWPLQHISRVLEASIIHLAEETE